MTKIYPVKRIVIHCSATPPSLDIGAKEIDEWHRKPKKEGGQGFTRIGYNYVIAAMVANRAAHRRIAESYGAFFLGDYEGESHDNLPGYLKADPVVTRWNEDFITGPDGEAVTRAWAQALLTDDPDAIVSNYMGAHPRSPGTDPWYDGYYGEQNGRTRGLETILRPQ